MRFLTKLGISYFPHLCNLEARWRRSAITQGFRNSLQEDFDDIRDHLPNQPKRILDIGCGLGGIDVFLSDRFGSMAPHFYLLDKTSVEQSIFYEFHEQAAFYNSLILAREFLSLNGVKASSITCLEAAPDNRIDIEPGLDLVISLISWGFHYPVTTYLAEVGRALSPSGVVILDVRKGTAGLRELRSLFSEVRVISEKPKFLRLLARNSSAHGSS